MVRNTRKRCPLFPVQTPLKFPLNNISPDVFCRFYGTGAETWRLVPICSLRTRPWISTQKKPSIDPYAARCDSRIFVYRFRDQSGKFIEQPQWSGTWGRTETAEVPLRQSDQCNDVAIVATRWMGHSHIVPARFSIMETWSFVNKPDDPSHSGK